MLPAASPIVDAKRQAVVDHVVAAAGRHMMDHGLDVTMDDLASAAGVSRRTLFRLFGSRESLIAAAFAAGVAGLTRSLPAFDGDLDSWLKTLCDTVHEFNSQVGPGFFELSSRPDLQADLAVAERERRRTARATAESIADTCWTGHGGVGPAPERLVHVVCTYLSGYFSGAVKFEAGQGWELASELSFRAIRATLDELA